MRISDIMRLGKSAIIFATIVVAFLAIIWLLGYKMIYKKILHGKKQISIGRIGLVCVLAVYIVVVLYVTLLRGGIGFGGFEYRANFYYQFVLERLKERGKYICAGLGLHCL